MFGLYAWFNERKERDDSSKKLRAKLKTIQIEEGDLLVKALYVMHKDEQLINK